MTAPFIQHQLVAPQRKLGPERFLLIVGRAPAPEKCASTIQLKTHLPPDEARGRVVFSDPERSSPRRLIYTLGDSFIATSLSVSPSVPTLRNNHLLGNRWRHPRSTWMSTCAHRLVYVIGTLQWINHLDPHLHFGYSLDCRISSHTVFGSAKLCLDYNPRGTVWKSQRVLSLYITGWCLHKSSHGIWQAACQYGSAPGLTAAQGLLPVSNHLEHFDSH